MKVLTMLLVAGATLAIPAAARPSRDPAPMNNTIGTDQTIRIVVTRLDLSRSQRAKVNELIGDAREDARKIERNRRLSPFQRQDRLTDIAANLRSRVIHVLDRDQKARLSDILSGDRYDGPRYRTNDDRRDYRSRADDRGSRSRDTSPNSRSRNDQPRGRSQEDPQDRSGSPRR
jgi:hypothetical protein